MTGMLIAQCVARRRSARTAVDESRNCRGGHSDIIHAEHRHEKRRYRSHVLSVSSDGRAYGIRFDVSGRECLGVEIPHTERNVGLHQDAAEFRRVQLRILDRLLLNQLL